jgi:DNA-binding LacI/PurR family transcriptional regulator
MATSGAKSMRPRLVDVAAMAGVSKSVASRILNFDSTLSARDETRERVLAVAKALGYTPHFGARALSRSRTYTIALVVDDLANPFYSTLFKGALSRSREFGYTIMIMEDSKGSPLEGLEDLVATGRVDGLMLAVSHGDSYRWSKEVGVPHVFVNRRVPGSNRDVYMDHAAAAATATEALVGFGHRHILHLRGPADNRPSQERADGIAQVAAARNIAVTTAYSELNSDDARDAVSERLRDSDRSWTAIVADTWVQMLGARTALALAELRIAEDVSLIVCDDLPLADYLVPRQATVGLSQFEMGAVAVEALVEQLQGGEPRDRKIATEPTLHLKESVGSVTKG